MTYTVSGSRLTFIEYVQLRVGLQHGARGRVTIDLVSPAGTVSHMATERPLDDNESYPQNGWPFLSVRHFGETQANGNWTILVKESTAVPPEKRGMGLFSGCQLSIFGF